MFSQAQDNKCQLDLKFYFSECLQCCFFLNNEHNCIVMNYFFVPWNIEQPELEWGYVL